MYQISNLTYSIGERILLKDVNWIIGPGERIALIGPNGAGKTTLLRILAGELQPGSLDIIRPKDFSIGYLPQEEVSMDQGGILDIVMEGRREIGRIREEMEALHERLDQGESKLVDRLGMLEDRYRHLGGYELDMQAKKILSGLGFADSEFDQPLSTLSGGWRMRVYLARLLLLSPSLLLLDEPTNHLDLPSLEWIEDYLKTYSGSMVIVSHDRFFIRRLAQKIAELDHGKLTHYSGGLEYYQQQKELFRDQVLKKWREQQEERQRLQRFIDRFRYKNTKAAQVQSRVKMLEKMEPIDLPEEEKTVHFRIKADRPSFKNVLKMENMSFRYDSKWVLQDIDLNLYRGERVALVGVNGAGKTTLTRLISSELKPQAGKIELGQNVSIGYYAQHQIDALNLNNTVLQEVAGTAASSFQPQLRNILGVFRFSGDDVEKPVRVLSGGEKARVSLAKILLSPCNFLIMDEPTNHLDLASRQALEAALADYDGTLMLISHDRYFLDKLVNRVIEISDHRIRIYEGNYSAYLEKRRQAVSQLTKPSDPATVTKPSVSGRKSKEQKQQEAAARQAISRERRQLEREIAELEERIDRLEQEKIRLEEMLGKPGIYSDPQKAEEANRRYLQIGEELPIMEQKWEERHLNLEELLKNLIN